MHDYHIGWPKRFAADVTPRVKAGRACHWLGVVIAAGFVCYGAVMAMFIQPGVIGFLKLASSLCYGIGLALFGRMARMMLSRE